MLFPQTQCKCHTKACELNKNWSTKPECLLTGNWKWCTLPAYGIQRESIFQRSTVYTTSLMSEIKEKKRWAGDCNVDNNGKTNCGIRSTHKTYEDKQICKWFRTHLCSSPFLGPEAWYFANLPLTGCAHDGYVNTSMVLWMTSTPPSTCPGPRGRGSFLWPVSWTSYFYSVTLTNVPVNQTCYMITRRK